MSTLINLLRYGYFPKEVPPPFNTSTFANLISSEIASLPIDFRSKNIKALATEHNIARVGTLRRKLEIPNPITQFLLCEEIDKNWPMLQKHMRDSPLSLSKPRHGNDSTRAFFPIFRPNWIPRMRTRHRLGAKYLLKTDIANFYHSIYTHSIPWALHGKQNSKEKREFDDLIGNRLDVFARNCRDGQTTGIPIGPDTSFLLSEILLSSIDRIIVSKLRKIDDYKPKGFRYVDDYELCFSSLPEAEIALSHIESSLSQFELALNPSKTVIKKLPASLENYWVRELKTFEFRPKAQRNDIISYFSRSFELAEENPEQYVLRYAIAKFRSTKIDPNNWPLLETLLLECAGSEPGTIDSVLKLLIQFSSDGYSINLKLLEEILNSQIIEHAPLNHGSEVAWSLWGAIAFDVQLHSITASIVSKMDDSVVALLALDAEQRGLFQEKLDKDIWSQHMNKAGLYEDHWLLSYEASVKKWIPLTGRDYVNEDSRFSYLKKNGVQFYDVSRAAKVNPSEPLPSPNLYYNVSG